MNRSNAACNLRTCAAGLAILLVGASCSRSPREKYLQEHQAKCEDIIRQLRAIEDFSLLFGGKKIDGEATWANAQGGIERRKLTTTLPQTETVVVSVQELQRHLTTLPFQVALDIRSAPDLSSWSNRFALQHQKNLMTVSNEVARIRAAFLKNPDRFKFVGSADDPFAMLMLSRQGPRQLLFTNEQGTLFFRRGDSGYDVCRLLEVDLSLWFGSVCGLGTTPPPSTNTSAGR